MTKYRIGDLVKIVQSHYYIEDKDTERVGLIKDSDPGPDVVYTVIVAEEDGELCDYYYYEYEIECI